MHSLTIPSIRQKVFIGCHDEEQHWPQFLTIDVVLSFDMTQAAESDDIHNTIDYMAVLELVTSVCESQKYKLIETLSVRIAKELASRWSMLDRIVVKISKRVSEKCDPVICHFELCPKN